MEWLNYHHLLYFWTVARLGSIARASEEIHLSPPTISGQIRALEKALGEKLFRKIGRGLILTDFGQLASRYAETIFSTGREFMETVRGRPPDRPLRFVVGIADVVPKWVAYRLLAPILHLPEAVQLVCREGKPDRLLADLAIHELDMVLTDAPVPPMIKVRAFNHLLAESMVSIFGAPAVAARYRRRFPQSLEAAPMLLPTENTSLRRSLEQWFHEEGIRPKTVGEFEDSALLKVFGQTGHGLFPAPVIIERDVRAQHGAIAVGRIPGVRERFYAVSVERRISHPAVQAISSSAKRNVVD
ncbi:MAG: transcriptional activator NhaR [Nitrospirae bacterium]|nr:transcriptional activator NhaR [Nitrospirota bacterium]